MKGSPGGGGRDCVISLVSQAYSGGTQAFRGLLPDTKPLITQGWVRWMSVWRTLQGRSGNGFWGKTCGMLSAVRARTRWNRREKRTGEGSELGGPEVIMEKDRQAWHVGRDTLRLTHPSHRLSTGDRAVLRSLRQASVSSGNRVCDVLLQSFPHCNCSHYFSE